MKTTDDGAALRIAAISRDARVWATRTVAGKSISFRVISRGVLYDTRVLPRLVAIHGGDKVGLPPRIARLTTGTESSSDTDARRIEISC